MQRSCRGSRWNQCSPGSREVKAEPGAEGAAGAGRKRDSGIKMEPMKSRADVVYLYRRLNCLPVDNGLHTPTNANGRGRCVMRTTQVIVGVHLYR